MSKVSSLQYKNKDFSVTNRDKTYRNLCLMAVVSQCSTKVRRKSSRLTGIKNIVRKKYPELSEKEVTKAQDNISEWFGNHKDDSVFDSYRSQLPFIFTIKQEVSEVVENSPVDEQPTVTDSEVSMVHQYATIGAKQVETPSGWKVQF
jgi:hypothetical protein